MPPFTDPGANRRANEVNPNFYIITNKPLLHYRGRYHDRCSIQR